MATQSSAVVAQRWVQRIGQATDAVRQGVQATTVNPAERAAARSDAWVQGVQQAQASGKYKRGLQRVTLQSWQDAMITKGLPRIAAGAAAAQNKMQAFLDQWLPYQDAGKAKLASMPRGSLDQNIQRMIAMVQHNAAFQRR